MSTISASTTSTTGFKVTSDTTGTLVFQTGASPTTAMSISSSQIISFTNPPTATGGGSVATNTAYGTSALAANTTGAYNTSVGYQAGYAITTGQNNSALGTSVMSTGTGVVGNGNLGAGSAALYALTSGSLNTAVGCSYGAGTAVLGNNTTGSYNIAVGSGALNANTTSNYNTAVGYQAGYSTVLSGNNVFIGANAGYSHNTATSTNGFNCFVGINTGYSVTTGTINTFVGSAAAGFAAGYLVTTGSKNTILGGYNGNQGGLDIRTASNYIVLSDGDGNPRGWWDNSGIFFANPTRMRINGNSMYDVGNGTGITFGVGFIPTDGTGAAIDNSKSCGTAAFRFTIVYATTGTINTSDANQKQDIASLDDAEKRVAVAIKSLIKKYRFRDAVAEKGDAARIHVGAVAQEVQAAFVAEGLDPTRYALFCSDTWYEVDGKASVDTPYTAETEGAVEVTRLGLRYDELLAFVIAAL